MEYVVQRSVTNSCTCTKSKGREVGRLLKNIFGCGARHIDLFRSSLSIRCGLTGTASASREARRDSPPWKNVAEILIDEEGQFNLQVEEVVRSFYPKGVINSDFATTVTDRIELKRGECNKSD